jgi:hypothetical protein
LAKSHEVTRSGNSIGGGFLFAVAGRFRPGRVAKQLINLVMKDERQASQTEQQQDDRRNKAGPSMNDRPSEPSALSP